MVSCSPRFDPRLIHELERGFSESESIAELWRTVGAAADRLQLSRPSYATVRRYTHLERRRQVVLRQVRAMLGEAAYRVMAGRMIQPEALLERVWEAEDRYERGL